MSHPLIKVTIVTSAVDYQILLIILNNGADVKFKANYIKCKANIFFTMKDMNPMSVTK